MKVQVSGELLGAVADEVAGATPLVTWEARMRVARGSCLGSPSVADELTTTRGDQERRAELLADSLTAAGDLARATVDEVARVDDELGAGTP